MSARSDRFLTSLFNEADEQLGAGLTGLDFGVAKQLRASRGEREKNSDHHGKLDQ